MGVPTIARNLRMHSDVDPRVKPHEEENVKLTTVVLAYAFAPSSTFVARISPSTGLAKRPSFFTRGNELWVSSCAAWALRYSLHVAPVEVRKWALRRPPMMPG